MVLAAGSAAERRSESALRVSPELKSRNLEVPWREVAAFRNVVVRDHLALDLEAFWDVGARDLPALKDQVVAMLEGAE